MSENKLIAVKIVMDAVNVHNGNPLNLEEDIKVALDAKDARIAKLEAEVVRVSGQLMGADCQEHPEGGKRHLYAFCSCDIAAKDARLAEMDDRIVQQSLVLEGYKVLAGLSDPDPIKIFGLIEEKIKRLQRVVDAARVELQHAANRDHHGHEAPDYKKCPMRICIGYKNILAALDAAQRGKEGTK